MQSKTYTALILLLSLVAMGFAARSLKTVTKENVYQATQRYTTSGHAERESQSFTNWNHNDPPVVPANCAGCHGTPGFLDFLGEDGSTPGVVDQDAPAGSVITCIACHNPTAHTLEYVVFHSGEEYRSPKAEASCLICHQSRQSTDGIRASLQGLADDAVSPELSFINPHYNFAASTQLGSLARSGYEYPGQQYAGYFEHASGARTCVDCHNPHDLTVEAQLCAACHPNVTGREDYQAIRTQPSDYDGDGDSVEGIHSEIMALHSWLLKAIQQYATNVAGKSIVYGDAFPYFFIDSNDNAKADPDEINRNNQYDTWTPKMIRAAYNYQFVKKDAGGYVHNPRYVIQLLHDSLMELGKQIPSSDLRLSRP